jgi:hypothetical protein
MIGAPGSDRVTRMQKRTRNRSSPRSTTPYMTQIISKWMRPFCKKKRDLIPRNFRRDTPAPHLTCFPGAQQPANQDDLAQVICVMVRDQQSFAQNRLPGAMGNGGEEVGLGIGDQFLHRRKVSRK